MKISQLKEYAKLIPRAISKRENNKNLANQMNFMPTPYLSHPFLQSIYNLAEPQLPLTFHR